MFRPLVLLALTGCSQVTPAAAPAPTSAPTAAPAPILPWTSPCRVPVERVVRHHDDHDRIRFVLETTQEGEQIRFARRDLRLVELNGEDMTTPEQLDNAVRVAAPERAVPDVLLDREGQATPAPIPADDVVAKLDRRALAEVAAQEWFTLVGAWRDHQPGERVESRAIYRSEGVRPVKITAERRGDTWTVSHAVDGKDVLGIPWLRGMLQYLIEMNDVERSPAPSVESVFVSGRYEILHEVTFLPGSRKPARATWTQHIAYDVDGMQADDRYVHEYTFDWARAEGCR